MSRYSSRSPARRAAGIESHLDPSERQRERATAQDDLRPVLRREPRRQRPVVQIGGDPNARVESPRGRAGPFGEEEGVGVDGGRQLIVAFLGGLPVQEGQLGQGEEEVRIAPRRDHGSVQIGQRGFGALCESVEEAQLEEHVACRHARLARGDGAPGVFGVDDLGIVADGLHRTGASGEGEAEDCEKDSAHARLASKDDPLQSIHRDAERTQLVFAAKPIDGAAGAKRSVDHLVVDEGDPYVCVLLRRS